MTFTDRTHWRSRRKEHALKLMVALGERKRARSALVEKGPDVRPGVR